MVLSKDSQIIINRFIERWDALDNMPISVEEAPYKGPLMNKQLELLDNAAKLILTKDEYGMFVEGEKNNI